MTNQKSVPQTVKKEEQLSLQDKLLQEKINMLVESLLAGSGSLPALNQLKEIVKSATTTMTSVPKPFKFLRPHYSNLCNYYHSLQSSQVKTQLADFLSVLAMTFGSRQQRLSLKFLLEGSRTQFKAWGHEYILHLASNIGKEYQVKLNSGEDTSVLIRLVEEILPYFIDNNAQHDAIDLLLIVDKLDWLKKFVTASNFVKINQYLVASSSYSADQEELQTTLSILYDISLQFGQYNNALRMAMKLDNYEKMAAVFQACKEPDIRKQLAFNLARQRVYIPELEEELNKIINNSLLSKYFIDLAKDLEAIDPKNPQQIYKTHLQNKKVANLDSLKENIATTYVNAFVNAGLKNDLLVLSKKEKNKDPWIWKTKGDGNIATVASIGMLNIWDPETGSEDVAQYLQAQGYTAAGAYLAIGIYNAGITSEEDSAKALLSQALESKDVLVKAPAILGLGIAYAGQARQDILQILVPFVLDTNLELGINAMAALSLGLIFVGKCNDNVAGVIITTLMEKDQKELQNPLYKFFAVGLGLIFLGQQNRCESTIQAIEAIQGPMHKYLELTILGLAYAGSGNVLMTQKMLHQTMESNKYSQLAVVSLALIAAAQEVGNDMSHRLIGHILHYGTSQTKKMVSLALAVLNISNPKISVMDQLLKLAHDTDQQISNRAIISLGLIGAGTNNSRIAQMLRVLANYKQPNQQFCVKIAQGLLYMGKGMMTIQPYHSQKFLMNKVAMAGVITFVHSLVEINTTLLGKYHYIMFSLALAMYPKMLFTLSHQLNSSLQNMPVQVRVGQAIDTVGQAGKPKKITGFQTHQSPVLIGFGERAQLDTQEYIPVQETQLQNLVILKKNPNYQPEEEKPVRKKTSY